MKPLQQVLEYTYNDIKVLVSIDHVAAEVSLVEYNKGNKNYSPKQWVFVKRGLEFMNGWKNILAAIQFAVGEATKLLEHDLAESSKFEDK